MQFLVWETVLSWSQYLVSQHPSHSQVHMRGASLGRAVFLWRYIERRMSYNVFGD